MSEPNELMKKKINNLKVIAAPKWGGEDTRPFRGEDLFKFGFKNHFLSAKTFSGKTSNIYFILKRIMCRKTKLIIFASKVNHDPTWLFMIPYFRKKGIDVEVHTSIYEGKRNILREMVAKWDLEINAEVPDETKKPDPVKVLKQKGQGIIDAILQHNMPPEVTGAGKKEKKSKYQERKYVMVLDDLSDELKDPAITSLLKSARHLHMDVFISSQYYKDIIKGARSNIAYYLLYGGIPEDVLEVMYKDAGLSIEYPEFLKLYYDASAAQYEFLYVDTIGGTFRKNYNEEYQI